MPTDMYITADGSPRYGIRTDAASAPANAPCDPLFGTAVEQAERMDHIQLDFIGRFPQEPDEAQEFKVLRAEYQAEHMEAAEHVASKLGSPRKWLRDAESRGDEAVLDVSDLGDTLRRMALLLTVIFTALTPFAAAAFLLLQTRDVLASAGAYFISAVILLPATRAARRELARDGLYSKRLTRREMNWIWDDLVRATFAELLADRRAEVSPALQKKASAAWKTHVHVAGKVDEIRFGPAA